MYLVAIVGLFIILHDSSDEFMERKRRETENTCYECNKDCNKVGDNIPTAPTKSYTCCFTAHVRNSDDEMPYAIRGTQDPTGQSTSCDETVVCKNVRDKLGTGQMIACRTCKLSVALCNNDTYIPPLDCYNCRSKADDCRKNNKEMPVKPCKSQCCYAATLFSLETTEYVYVRKCAPDGWTNGDTNVACTETDLTKYYGETKATKWPEKILEFKPCTSIRCNKDDLQKPFKCYTCEGEHCRTIGRSPLRECMSPECCYSVHKQNSVDEQTYVVRGCHNSLLGVAGCTNICKNLQSDHKKVAGDHATFECDSCAGTPATASDGCNNKTYVPRLHCYHCDSPSCYEIDKDGTSDVECTSGCCLSARVYSDTDGFHYIRGCATKCNSSTCDATELQALKKKDDVDVLYCEKCDEFKCNRAPMDEPFKCYTCTHCNSTTGIEPKDCRKPSCCYTKYFKAYANRGCMKWTSGVGCPGVCDKAGGEDDSNSGGDVEEYCVPCADDAKSGCNDVPYEPQNIEVSTGPPSIMCYSCKKNCNEVTYDTPRVRCAEDRCCYRAAWSERYEQPLSAERGCIKVQHGGSCEKACHHVEEKHRQLHPNGTYLVCLQCDSGDKDNCNGDDFILPKHVVPDNRKTLAIRCYKCSGCEKLLSITHNTHCRHPKCCYSAFLKDGPNGSYYTVRDCSEWQPGTPCDNTCELVGKYHKLAHKHGSVYDCKACEDGDWNECNRKVFVAPRKAERPPPIICHKCSNCNDVATFRSSAECPLSECCYRALLKKTAEQSLYVQRDCLKLKPGQSCNNTCQYIERSHYEKHKRGLFHVCIQCKENDKDGCNGKRFYSAEEFTEDQRQPGEISCYDCRNCSKVSHDTPTVECRAATCCYTAFLADRPHQQQYAIRGCARWRRGRSCVHTCKDLRSDHLWMHPYGVFVKCRACKAGDLDKCNNYQLYEPKSITPASTQFTSLMCYECRNCYHVESHTPTVECPAPQCCYTAHVKNHEDDIFSVNRGCGKWDRQNRCRRTCKEVRNDHLWMNPVGVFLKCNTCNDGDEDECNNQYYEAPITPTSRRLGPPMLMCYQCSHCNTVNATTPKVRCHFPKCCYIVLVRNKPEEELYAMRGCASTNKPCPNTCRTIKDQHLRKHTHGTFDHCMTCNIGESDECNRNTVDSENSTRKVTIRKTVEPVNMVHCYECRNCNEVVVAKTNTTPCISPKCCYVALVKDYTAQHQFAVRGCAQNCSTRPAFVTCTNAETAYGYMYPEGEFKFCLPCGETEGDECNDNIYNPPQHIARKRLDDGSNQYSCFKCENCKEITMDTIKVYCGSNCCYSRVVRGKIQRGCAMDLFGPCEEYCQNHVAAYCESCTGDKCNIQRIQSDTLKAHTIFKRTSSVRCYECAGCYSLTGLRSKTIDCPDKCCILMWWTEHNVTSIVRMCARLNGGLCHDYCPQSREVVRSKDPTGVVHYCEDCSTDNCNYMDLTHGLVKRYQHIRCYESINCPKVTRRTIDGVCIPGCCYSAVFKNNGKLMTVRSCANIVPSRPCRGYCKFVEAEYKKENPEGDLVRCASCSSNKCNGLKLTDIPLWRPTRNYFSCYDCVGCYSMRTKTTPKAICRSQCCYTIIWEELGPTTMMRQCADGKSPCQNYCNTTRSLIASNDPNGKVHFCESCTQDSCNSKQQSKPQPVTHKPPILRCQQCRKCKGIQSNATLVECPAGCCYSAVLKIVDIIHYIRECVKIMPGRSCSGYCVHVQRDHQFAHQLGKVNYCNVCDRDNCNNEILDDQYHPPNASHSLTETSYRFKCYTCMDCDTISEDTPLFNCKTHCCVTLIKYEDDIITSLRKCPRLKGVPCEQYCLHLATTIKLLYCEVCNINRCNAMPTGQLPTELIEPKLEENEPIDCYRCDNCALASVETPTMKCYDRCCVSIILENDKGGVQTKRDCAPIIPGRTCRQYCMTVRRDDIIDYPIGSRNFYCKTCSTDKCNRQDLQEDQGLPDHGKAPTPTSLEGVPVKCYTCMGCYTMMSSIKSLDCPSGCCLTAVWTEDGGTQITRLCADLEGVKCENYCNLLTSRLGESEDSTMSHCTTCCTANCNRDPIKKPQGIIARDPRPSTCYLCEDCDVPKVGTTITAPCLTGCCYSTLKFFNDGTRLSSRGCVQITPGTPCRKFCERTRLLHMQTNPRGSLPHCETCTGAACKIENVVPYNTGIIKGIDKEINCYECVNCYNIPEGESVACPTGCCLTIKWTVHKTTNLARRCVRQEETPCSEFCPNAARIVLTEDNSGTVDHCDVCGTDNCNIIIILPLPDPITPKCYKCEKDCNSVQEPSEDTTHSATPTTQCPSNYCYAYMSVDNTTNRQYINRDCCKMNELYKVSNKFIVDPLRKCCDYAAATLPQNQTIRQCLPCMGDSCNNMTFTTPTTTTNT